MITRCAVTGLDVSEGKIRTVATSLGTIETGIVVCAAGAWSPALSRMIGLELPVQPVLREIGFTAPVDGLPGRIPLTVDFSTGFYFHREGPGLLFGMATRDQQPGFDEPADPAWLEKVIDVAERRLPRLLDMGIAGGWKGFYEVTPDHNALVGEAGNVSRFLYATGFSGHGFLQAPAVGEIVRDLVLRRTPFIDVAPLSVDRFAWSAPRPEHNVI